MASTMSLGLLIDWRLYACFFAAWVISFYIRYALSALPPGPWPLPILGNFFQLGLQPHINLAKLHSRYGDVMTVYMGSRPTVILQSEAAVKEAFTRNADATSDRRLEFIFREIMKQYGHNAQGLVSANGSVWKEQRPFALRVLKDLGMGRTVLQDGIQEEAQELVKRIRSVGNQAFNPREFIAPAVSNIICSLVFGRRFEYDDPIFIRALTSLNENFQNLRYTFLLNLWPVLRFLPGDLLRLKMVRRNICIVRDWILDQKKEVKGRFEEGNVDDYISAYFTEQKHVTNSRSNTSFTDVQLEKAISDLFIAGTETTTTSLVWAILYLLHNPSIQDRIHQEIDKEIGRERVPTWEDRTKLPYVEAFLLEVQRAASIVPLGVLHMTTAPISVRNKHIPENVNLTPNLWFIHHDPNYWQNPEKIDPGRFLDEHGKIKKNPSYLPFSTGCRVCLGEALAKMEFFLFFINLVQQFKFECLNGEKPPNETIVGVTLMPAPYQVCVKSRQ